MKFSEFINEAAGTFSRTPKDGYSVMATIGYIDPITSSRTLKKIYFKNRSDAEFWSKKPTGFPKGAAVEAIKDL